METKRLTIYSGFKYSDVEDLIVDCRFPEQNKSPEEQIEWIRDHIKDKMTVLTFSPYIMNYLNLALAKRDITPDELDVIMISKDIGDDPDDNQLDLVIQDVKRGRHLVDTRDFSDPITNIYDMFNHIYETDKDR